MSQVGKSDDPCVYARIGWDSDGEYDHFEGKIDNVMIFDRALSTEEIASLAEAGNDNVLSVAATVYDKAGNLTVDYRGYKYSYDYENRLIEIADNDDTSIVAYAYDALGRRIQKDDRVAGAKTRYYNNHDWQVLAEYDDNGYHLRSYIYGGYIDEVLVMVDPNAAEDYYYAHNHLYSPTALLDDAGAIIERYDYDAYGRPYFLDPNLALSATQSSAYKNTVLFTGRTVDILDNGSLTLQYSRNRYYDYHSGRWLTKDPTGYRGGVNLYQYVRSNPVIYTDSKGLLQEEGYYLNPEYYNPEDCRYTNECEDDENGGGDPFSSIPYEWPPIEGDISEMLGAPPRLWPKGTLWGNWNDCPNGLAAIAIANRALLEDDCARFFQMCGSQGESFDVILVKWMIGDIGTLLGTNNIEMDNDLCDQNPAGLALLFIYELGHHYPCPWFVNLLPSIPSHPTYPIVEAIKEGSAEAKKNACQSEVFYVYRHFFDMDN